MRIVLLCGLLLGACTERAEPGVVTAPVVAVPAPAPVPAPPPPPPPPPPAPVPPAPAPGRPVGAC